MSGKCASWANNFKMTADKPDGFYKRLAWLLACLGIGVAIGAMGSMITGDAYWYVAIPATVALGWLFFANPSECEPPSGRRRRDPPGE